MKEILNFLYNKIHNPQVITQYQINIIFPLFHLSHNSAYSHFPQIVVTSFLARKCSKCGTVASYEYYFIEKTSWTTYHRNLIDPSLKHREVSSLLRLYFTNCNYHTVAENSMSFAISVKNWRKTQSLDVTLGHVTKFQKE